MTSPFTRAIQRYRIARGPDVGGSAHARGKARQFGIHPPLPCFLEPFEDGVALNFTDPDTELYSDASVFHEVLIDSSDAAGTVEETWIILTFHQALDEINYQFFNIIKHELEASASIEMVPVLPVGLIVTSTLTWFGILTNILDETSADFYQTLTWNKRAQLTLDGGSGDSGFIFVHTTTVENPDLDLGAPTIDPVDVGMASSLDKPLSGRKKLDDGPYYGLLLRINITLPIGTEISNARGSATARILAPLQETGVERGFVGNLSLAGTDDKQLIKEAR